MVMSPVRADDDDDDDEEEEEAKLGLW